MSNTVSDFIWEESNRLPWQRIELSSCCEATVHDHRPEDSHAMCVKCGEWSEIVYEDELE